MYQTAPDLALERAFHVTSLSTFRYTMARALFVLGALGAAATLLGAALAQQPEDDYAFVVLSDIHIGEGYPR